MEEYPKTREIWLPADPPLGTDRRGEPWDTATHVRTDVRARGTRRDIARQAFPSRNQHARIETKDAWQRNVRCAFPNMRATAVLELGGWVGSKADPCARMNKPIY